MKKMLTLLLVLALLLSTAASAYAADITEDNEQAQMPESQMVTVGTLEELLSVSTNEKLTAAWNNASAAVQQYGSYLAAVAATQSALNAASSSIGGGSTIGSMGDY